MTSYNYSYNVLINRLEAFAAGHFLIKRFTHGQIDLADQLQDDQYPFMHVTPDTITPVQGGMQFGFHIMFADIPRDKEYKAEYQREVISDCIRLGQDLVAEIRNGLQLFGFDVQLVNDVVFEPFMEEQKNTVTGVAFTIKLEVPWDWSACDIPAIWSVGGSSSGGSGTPYGIVLRTNGVDNPVQNILDLVQGTNVTITDNGDGSVTIDAAGGGDYVSTEWNANHTTAQGNPYQIGDRVWYNGSVYTCIANNDGINPSNPSYWTLVAVGHRLRQTPVDWNATSGDYQILNKPTIPSPQDLQGVTTIGNETTNTIIVKNVFGFQVKTSANQVLADMKPDGSGTEGVVSIYSNTGFYPATTYTRTGINNIAFPTSGSGTFALSVNGVTPNASTGDITISTGSGTVTSVGLSMPAAFNVTGSPITTSGTLAVTGTGTTNQYVDGTGALQTMPTGLPPTGTAGGDLMGTYPNPTVSHIHGIEMQAGTPTAGDVWLYEGSPAKWQHQKLPAIHITNDSAVTGTTVKDALNHLNTTKVETTRTISTTAPLSGGGDLSANRTLSIADAEADGSTKGAATFTASDFNSASGVISIDYTNAQKATSGQPGFLTAADWSTFNGKQNNIGLTTVGNNLATLPNPSAVTYLRVNADNTVTARTPAQVLTDLGISANIILFRDSTIYTLANTTTNTLVWSGSIAANTFQVNDVIDFQSLFQSNTPNGIAFNLRLYVNTSAAIAGATQVGRFFVTNAATHGLFYRQMIITATGASGNLRVFSNGATTASAYSNTNATTSNITINTTGTLYFILAFEMGNNTSTSTIQYINALISR